jgi:hypothetical protein
MKLGRLGLHGLQFDGHMLVCVLKSKSGQIFTAKVLSSIISFKKLPFEKLQSICNALLTYIHMRKYLSISGQKFDAFITSVAQQLSKQFGMTKMLSCIKITLRVGMP